MQEKNPVAQAESQLKSKKDAKSGPRKRAIKKVSAAGRPKFLGRATEVRIQKDFPRRDSKFMGRTKKIY
jgi:hypothetical protein